MKPESFAQDVCELQRAFTEQWHIDESATLNSNSELQTLMLRQHCYNFDFWHYEDKAREPGAEDGLIAQVKRNIDGLNQKRNDAIIEIDILLQTSVFNTIKCSQYTPWNSETVGSIVDRLSIAAPKGFSYVRTGGQTGRYSRTSTNLYAKGSSTC
jgi:hypothetical protein